MRTGYIISGIGHGLLILWLLVGGLIAWQRDEPALRVAEVSLVSAEEFAALVEGPEAPAAPDPVRPAPRPEPEPEPEPAPPPPRPEPPAPEPEPEPEPEPPAPEPEPEPPAPEPETPPEAPRVADEVIAPPDEPVPPGPELIEPTAPQEVAEPEAEPAVELPAQAPEATTTEIVTEAETPTAAPTTSPRPPRKPTPPAPEEVAEATPAPDSTLEPDRDDAIEGALAEALGEATGPVTGGVPSGPPLTRGEKDGLRIAVQDCWNVGSLSTDALNTTVVVLVRMAADGKPESVEMVSSDGATDAAARGAYEAARRAVIRCGARGFPLPAEKYDQWREIEMTFDPSNMRIR